MKCSKSTLIFFKIWKIISRWNIFILKCSIAIIGEIAQYIYNLKWREMCDKLITTSERESMEVKRKINLKYFFYKRIIMHRFADRENFVL